MEVILRTADGIEGKIHIHVKKDGHPPERICRPILPRAHEVALFVDDASPCDCWRVREYELISFNPPTYEEARETITPRPQHAALTKYIASLSRLAIT